MDKSKLKSLLISDFNIDILAGYLGNDGNGPLVEAASASFGQVIPVLVDQNMDCWRQNYDFVVVWTQPQMVIGSFQEFLNYEIADLDDVLSEVDEFARALLSLQGRVNSVFVQTLLSLPQGVLLL